MEWKTVFETTSQSPLQRLCFRFLELLLPERGGRDWGATWHRVAYEGAKKPWQILWITGDSNGWVTYDLLAISTSLWPRNAKNNRSLTGIPTKNSRQSHRVKNHASFNTSCTSRCLKPMLRNFCTWVRPKASNTPGAYETSCSVANVVHPKTENK